MRRATLESRHLLKEARRILKKKGAQLPGAVAATVRAAMQGVVDASAAADVDRMRKANITLDEVMDDHLSFARKSTLREYAESIGVAIAVALLLRAFVVEAFQIPSGSMIPTLEVGDHIFVSKFSYGLSIPFTDTKILQYSQPARGDVIVFKFPQDTSTDYIKRVVGLPGDTVEVRQGQLYVNGNEIHRERVPERCHYSEVSTAGVPDDHDCERWVETLGKNLRYGFRMLVRDPGFTTVAVLTLALGIGINTSIFSLISDRLLKPLPYKDADRLVVVRETRSDDRGWSLASVSNFVAWRNLNRVFDHIGSSNDATLSTMTM